MALSGAWCTSGGWSRRIDSSTTAAESTRGSDPRPNSGPNPGRQDSIIPRIVCTGSRPERTSGTRYGRAPAPGAYLVRLSQGASVMTARGVIPRSLAFAHLVREHGGAVRAHLEEAAAHLHALLA